MKNEYNELSQKTNTHLAILLVASIVLPGLIVEGLVEKWEFWVLPLLAAALVTMWWIHIGQILTPGVRERYYIGVLMLSTFFHGVHETRLFDIAIINILMMTILELTQRMGYLHMGFVEYVVILVIQMLLSAYSGNFDASASHIAEIFMNFAGVTIIYRLNVYRLGTTIRQEKMLQDYVRQIALSDRTREDFLANVSHEFRTPLNAVTGLSSLLYKQYGDERLYEIMRAGARLVGQVTDISDYTQITSDRIVVTEADYDTQVFFKELANINEPEFAEKGLELVVDYDPKLPAQLIGDTALIKKIIRQLLSNALKFTEKGGAYLKISFTKRTYGINLDIEVTDTGAGMDQSAIDRLGMDYYQEDKGRDRNNGGIGLGYVIVYGYVHAMEGFVSVTSKKGAGTTVRVSIPQKIAKDIPSVEIKDAAKVSLVCFSGEERSIVPKIREFYEAHMRNFSEALNFPIRNAAEFFELKRLCEKNDVTHVVVDAATYENERAFFETIPKEIRISVICMDKMNRKAYRIDDMSGRICLLPQPVLSSDLAKFINGENIVAQKSIEKNKMYQGHHVLIVDDEKINRLVAQDIFKEYGLTSDTASSGAEALQMYEQADYDIIFMDHMMPGMDGVETRKQIIRTEKWQRKKTPIIAFTANAAGGAKDFLLTEGFSAFLPKPMDPDEFGEVMERLL